MTAALTAASIAGNIHPPRSTTALTKAPDPDASLARLPVVATPPLPGRLDFSLMVGRDRGLVAACHDEVDPPVEPLRRHIGTKALVDPGPPAASAQRFRHLLNLFGESSICSASGSE